MRSLCTVLMLTFVGSSIYCGYEAFTLSCEAQDLAGQIPADLSAQAGETVLWLIVAMVASMVGFILSADRVRKGSA